MLVRFDDVVGHERPIRALRRAWAGGRLHHAYLASGPEGVGKRAVAWALAALVNCEAPVGEGESSDACGRCPSCLKLRAGQHPDVTQVQPDGRAIKIDQVREIQAATRFRPYEGRARVFIIERAETLRIEAANALLKTLEEPRGDTMFMVISDQPHRLLSTIVSRCQPLRFGALSATEVVSALKASGHSAPLDPVLARLASGSVGRALSLAESPVYANRRDIVARWCALPSASDAEALGWAEEIGRARDEQRELLELLRSVVRDGALEAGGAEPARLLHVDERERVAEWCRGAGLPAVLELFEHLDEAERWLDGNVNARMVFERLFLAVRHPGTGNSRAPRRASA